MPNVNRRRPRNTANSPYNTASSRPARNNASEHTEAGMPARRRSRRLSGAAAEDTAASPLQEASARQTLPRLPPGSSSNSYTSSMRSTASPDWHGAEQPEVQAADESHLFGLHAATTAHSALMNFRPSVDPMAFALSFLLARNEQHSDQAANYTRARGEDPGALLTLPDGFAIISAMPPEHAFDAGHDWLAALQEGVTASGALYFASSPPPPARSALGIRVDTALEDVAKWYRSLPNARTTHISEVQASAHQCPISFVPYSDMSHPVSVRSSHVLHIYEAEDLLTWMQSSLSLDPEREHATNPLDRSPLTLAMLGRVEVKGRGV